MRLIDIISKVVLEQVRGSEVDTPERDDPRNPATVVDDLERERLDREENRRLGSVDREPTRDREQPTRDREQPTRDREQPRVARVVRPIVRGGNIEEPSKVRADKSVKTIKPTKNIKKPNEKTELLKKYKFDTLKDITDINKVQTKEFIDKVVDNIEVQLKQQPAKVTQTLKKYNVDAKVMAKLAPLSKESFKTIMGLESNGVKLPLLILLFKNKNKLYSSMKTGNPLTKKDVSPIGGGINHKQFWKWSSKLNNGWGKWLGTNVVKNFPEISKPTLSF
tara:strand:+ start:205 stop:1038 length:834 start_codon:yes stop_codon:yes gene_type:complete